jgi:hypothetical protein
MNAKKKYLLSGWAEDPDALKSSVERLMTLPIRTVYAGHLKPSPMQQFLKKNR